MEMRDVSIQCLKQTTTTCLIVLMAHTRVWGSEQRLAAQSLCSCYQESVLELVTSESLPSASMAMSWGAPSQVGCLLDTRSVQSGGQY